MSSVNNNTSIPTAPRLSSNVKFYPTKPSEKAKGYEAYDFPQQISPVEQGKIRILISGHEKTGKQTLYKLINDKLSNETENDLTDLGYSLKLIDFRMKQLADMNGGRVYETLMWNWLVPNISAIILLIDATDTWNLAYSQSNWFGKPKYKYTPNNFINEAIVKIAVALQLDDLKENPVPLLIFVTKQDLNTGLTTDQVAVALDLNTIKVHRQVHIQSLNCLTGEGLVEGMDFLSKQLKLKRAGKQDILPNTANKPIEGQIINANNNINNNYNNTNSEKTSMLSWLFKFIF